MRNSRKSQPFFYTSVGDNDSMTISPLNVRFLFAERCWLVEGKEARKTKSFDEECKSNVKHSSVVYLSIECYIK